MGMVKKWNVCTPAFFGTGYTVEAKTKKEAIEKAWAIADDGDCEFLDWDVDGATAEEVKPDG